MTRLAAVASERPEEAVRLYTVLQAAELLNVSDQWIYRRISEGALPIVELGAGRSKLRIRADHLQAFIDSRTH